MRVKRTRTASELLTIWGLRVTGGRFTNPSTPSTGGEPDAVDEELRVCDYVTVTPGFSVASPVLRWVYVEHHEPELYDPRDAGETLDFALGRLGWRDCLGMPQRGIGPYRHQRFLNALIDKTRLDPFEYFEEIPDHVLPLRAQPA